MMSSFFDTVPLALEEAAEIDGCNKAQTIFKIILPLSLPSLVSTGLTLLSMLGMSSCSDTYLSPPNKYRTLTPAIMLFKGVNTVDWGGLMAGSRGCRDSCYLYFPVPAEVFPGRINERFSEGLTGGKK